MALHLPSLLCTFENSTNEAKYCLIFILFRIAKRSIALDLFEHEIERKNLQGTI